jgi:hypothetical protein
MKGQK